MRYLILAREFVAARGKWFILGTVALVLSLSLMVGINHLTEAGGGGSSPVATVSLIARPQMPWPGAPTNLLLTRIDNDNVSITWSKGVDANTTVIVMKVGSYPADPTDGTVVYNNTGVSTVFTDATIDQHDYCFRAWSHNGVGYSLGYASQRTGGAAMTAMLVILALIAICLTVAMFVTREMMLGFPSAMFWAILGGVCYSQTTSKTWDNVYYLTFFASMGMTIFCVLAMFALREKPDASLIDEEGYYDEGGRGKRSPKSGRGRSAGEGYYDETEGKSKRTIGLRSRAKKRRSKFGGGGSGEENW